MIMKIGIPNESTLQETRVAAVPETVTKMVKAGMSVLIESGAGLRSFIPDSAYLDAGARIVEKAQALFEEADIILNLNRPQLHQGSCQELTWMKPGAVLIAPLDPNRHPELLTILQEKKITALSIDLIPRIARAQSMDILSSMSNLAGYQAVMMAAGHLPKIFPMLITAAGSIQPARVIVIGAGVAGLQAIATARRLGAVVMAFDTRPAAGEQIKSLGADFVSLEVNHQEAESTQGYAKEQSEAFYQQEQSIIKKFSKDADVIISSALIPGKQAPLLITEAMVKEMKPGSVIVDLSIEQGGNCALSELGKIIVKHQITLIGIPNLSTYLPVHASQLFARNLFALLSYIQPMLQAGTMDQSDEIIKACLLTEHGEMIKNTQG